jgi:hypothetical protein
MGAVIKLIPEFITISGATALYFPMAQWTKRHQEICLEEKLPPAAVHLWQWLNRRSKYEVN